MRRQPPEAGAIARRLEAEYRDRFDAIGGGFSAWVNATQIGVEALFGGRVGPVWGTSVAFGRRRWPLGPVVPVITVEEAERRIRREIDKYLDLQARPEESLVESLRKRVWAAAAEDHLGLWWIVRIIGDQWPRASEDSLREFVLSLLEEELAAGTLIAGFPTKTGGFVRWTGRPEEIVHEVDRLWKELGRRPNIGEVVWLTAPESSSKDSD